MKRSTLALLVLAALLPGCTQSASPATAHSNLDVLVTDGNPPPACHPTYPPRPANDTSTQQPYPCPTYTWPPPRPSRGAWVLVEAGNVSVAARTDDTGHARFLDLPHGEANVTVIWRNRNDHMETKSVLLAGASAKLGFTYVPPEGQ